MDGQLVAGTSHHGVPLQPAIPDDVAPVRRSVLPVPWLVRFRDIDHLSTALMEVHIEGKRDRASGVQVDPGLLGTVGLVEEIVDLLIRFHAGGGTLKTKAIRQVQTANPNDLVDVERKDD